MSAGSTHGTGSALTVWKIGAADSRLGCGFSGSNRPYVDSFWIMTVLTRVGWMLLTRMRCSANSVPTERMMPTTPCLAVL
jgi:hypothetical protein